jgi:uncharacterized protein YfkK (UPF0435 family)
VFPILYYYCTEWETCLKVVNSGCIKNYQKFKNYAIPLLQDSVDLFEKQKSFSSISLYNHQNKANKSSLICTFQIFIGSLYGNVINVTPPSTLTSLTYTLHSPIPILDNDFAFIFTLVTLHNLQAVPPFSFIFAIHTGWAHVRGVLSEDLQ